MVRSIRQYDRPRLSLTSGCQQAHLQSATEAFSTSKPPGNSMNAHIAIVTVVFVVLFAAWLFFTYRRAEDCFQGVATRLAATQHYAVVPDEAMRRATVEAFLAEMANEKPIRFTRGYSARLGAGGFGTVYRGALPNGLPVAVKVLRWGGLDGGKTSEEQFMAEMGTIGRTHHINLVRLFGFCFDDAARALVYEFMDKGALDSCLFDPAQVIGIPALRDIALGVARGLRYLHEECQQKIIHYDIKAGNVLLDGSLTPKVADFGLARLVNRADTHVSLSCVRGTPGYTAPEMWMQSGITEKCDVYSFGMLLLEIVGRRRNFDEAAPESQQWFPMLAWTKYEKGELMELVVPPALGHGNDDEDPGPAVAPADDQPLYWELAERMCKVAFWCVQPVPQARPPMGAVVKMLEGEMDIAHLPNPFQHLMASTPVANFWTTMASDISTTAVSTNGGVSRGSNEIVSL